MPRLPPAARSAENEMLAVVDTNVWVSAFLTANGKPAQILGAFRRGRLLLAYSGPIESEYRDVLNRSKFQLQPDLVAEFLTQLRAEGRREDHIPPCSIELPDPDDGPFIFLARFLGCPLVTGNPKHVPREAGVEVLSPSDCLTRLAEG